MDIPVAAGTFPAPMKRTTHAPAASPVAVAFREVRHFQPDDTVHVEALAVRGSLHDWTIPAHRHEGLHQFLWLGRGRADITLDGLPQAVAAPAVLMVAPGCVHALRSDPRSDGLQVTVPSARLQQLLAGAPVLAAQLQPSRVLHGPALPADQATRAAALFSELQAEFDSAEPGRSEALQARVLLLATWLLRCAGPVPAAVASQALRDTLVQRFRALLELHLRREHGLAFYAAALKVTPDHLSRCCRAVSGQPALDLLHERLLLEARRLLGRTGAGVAEVAQELGFADPAYFSRFFARRTGLAPQAWRQALQQGRVVV